jgi:hypothetical protein
MLAHLALLLKTVCLANGGHFGATEGVQTVLRATEMVHQRTPESLQRQILVMYQYSSNQGTDAPMELAQRQQRLENLRFFLRHGTTEISTDEVVYRVTISGQVGEAHHQEVAAGFFQFEYRKLSEWGTLSDAIGGAHDAHTTHH